MNITLEYPFFSDSELNQLSSPADKWLIAEELGFSAGTNPTDYVTSAITRFRARANLARQRGTPLVINLHNFSGTWEGYITAYSAANPAPYLTFQKNECLGALSLIAPYCAGLDVILKADFENFNAPVADKTSFLTAAVGRFTTARSARFSSWFLHASPTLTGYAVGSLAYAFVGNAASRFCLQTTSYYYSNPAPSAAYNSPTGSVSGRYWGMFCEWASIIKQMLPFGPVSAWLATPGWNSAQAESADNIAAIAAQTNTILAAKAMGVQHVYLWSNEGFTQTDYNNAFKTHVARLPAEPISRAGLFYYAQQLSVPLAAIVPAPGNSGSGVVVDRLGNTFQAGNLSLSGSDF
jgi:hypothetical protein